MEFDLIKIRSEMSSLAKNLNWYEKRGGLLPYDWNTYGHPHIAKLLDLLKLDWNGDLKFKDKSGKWRFIKVKENLDAPCLVCGQKEEQYSGMCDACFEDAIGRLREPKVRKNKSEARKR